MSVPLSVVIVNYDTGAYLGACVTQLLPQLPPGSEVIVVDNASTDGSADPLRTVAGVRVMLNRDNLGYAKATNQALAEARGERILLLNPDTFVEDGSLGVALRFLDGHPDVGVVGARIVLDDGRIDPASRRSFKTPETYLYKMTGLSRLFPKDRRFGRYYLSYLDPEAVADVDATVGAFMLIPHRVITEVGGFDERFYMYCEDEDLCWRIKVAGWRVVSHPGVIVRHRKGTSTRQRRTRMLVHFHRSLLLYHRKNIAPRYPAVVNLAVYAGIIATLAMRLPLSLVRSAWRRDAVPKGRAS